MHPILGSRARLGTYLLGWVPIAGIFAFVGLSQHWSLAESVVLALPLCILAAFLFLSSWYLCRAFPLKNWRLGSHATVWLLAAAVMASLWAACAVLLAWCLGRVGPLHDLPGKVRQALPVLVGMGSLLYLTTLAVHYLLDAVARTQQSEAKEDELRILAQDAELRALRAQLNPHFLFNSLNSISALTTLDPARARAMCILLSDFLRGSLKLGEKRMVALAEEVDLLKAYLSIEQIRFGSRLQVAWEIAPEVLQEPIPALLLQPLVENAIKHGIAGLVEGGVVRIAARSEGGAVELRVENPVDPDTGNPSGLGIGLRQVRSRLQLRFGARMRFEAGIQDGVHRVKMVFPAEGGHHSEAAT
jgi:LytS/YehU family sensor histidine kinase